MRTGIAVAAAVLLAGCAGTASGPDLSTLPFPVLVGPVHRIGGGAAELGGNPRTVETSVGWTDHGGARPSPPGEDAAAKALALAAAALPPGCLVTVKDLKGVGYYFSFFVPTSSGQGEAGAGTYVWGAFDVWIPPSRWGP